MSKDSPNMHCFTLSYELVNTWTQELARNMYRTRINWVEMYYIFLASSCVQVFTNSHTWSVTKCLESLDPSLSSFIFAALNSIPPLAPKPVVKWSLRSSQPCIPPPASAKKFRGSSSLIDRGKSDKWVDLVLTISVHIICNEYFKIVQIYYSFCQFCK